MKIGDTVSSFKEVKGAVPQGAIFGLECFIIMIDDLKVNHPVYKFVDDSTPFEIVHRNSVSTLQDSINQISEWTSLNQMRLNAQKTHEMTISFTKTPPNFDPIKIDNSEVDSVKSAKLVGVTIQNDLKWGENTDVIL